MHIEPRALRESSHIESFYGKLWTRLLDRAAQVWHLKKMGHQQAH